MVLAYALYHRTDAYRRGNRLFYSAGRPNRGGRLFGSFWVALADRGLTPSYMVTLETVGRRSGKVRAVPIVLGEHEGERYVVSMLGERSPWVGNVRAAGGHAVFRHGTRTPVRLMEVRVPERPTILKAYLARAAGARPHIRVDPCAPVDAFEAIAADYPAFRIVERRAQCQSCPGELVPIWASASSRDWPLALLTRSEGVGQ
jgi:deazaflavin-dependent oxidoreductase (nitroreductase family)